MLRYDGNAGFGGLFSQPDVLAMRSVPKGIAYRCCWPRFYFYFSSLRWRESSLQPQERGWQCAGTQRWKFWIIFYHIIFQITPPLVLSSFQ